MNINTSLQNKSVTIWFEKIKKIKEQADSGEHSQEISLLQKEELQNIEQSKAYKKKIDDNIVMGLVKKSNRILAGIRSHAFPFDFFPDAINVEDGRITIITRRAFSSEIHSVDIKDISNIFINTSFIFSQLVIVSNTFEDNQCEIRNLRNSEAIFVRRIIEGLRVFVSKGIDTSTYTTEELVAKLGELSTTEIVT